MNRKSFIQLAAATGVLATISQPSKVYSKATSEKKRVLRIAHLTDVHLQISGKSNLEFAKALHVAQESGADFIFNGGDAVFDTLKREKTNAMEQWSAWNRILKAENSLPVISCIGNHDVWGWDVKEEAAIKSDKDYGKQLAIGQLGLTNRYYSFDKAGWHFIVLDSTYASDRFAYTAKIDDVQLEWLKNDLRDSPSNTPVMIMSHIPILSAASRLFIADKQNDPGRELWAQTALSHTDSWILKNLFNQEQKVKLCIAGHLHMQEEIYYLGTKYLTNGAVCGNWWNGNFQEFKPSITMIDLFEDGSSAHQWINY